MDRAQSRSTQTRDLCFYPGRFLLHCQCGMKLSLRGEYALRALVVLGQNYGPAVVRIQTISDQQKIPKRFLEQILNDLRTARLVESKRGVSGGYRLALPPEKIRLS